MTTHTGRPTPATPTLGVLPAPTAVGHTSYLWPATFATALIIGISLAGVLSMPLAEPDEGRYAETARIMFHSGNWLVPYLGTEAFLDKPPLLYWLSALSFHFLGVTDAAARMPIFVAALCCMAIVFSFARRSFGSETAWLSVAVLASSPLFFAFGQLLTMDMLLTLWTTAGMAAVWLGTRSGGKAWIRLAYVVSAVGVLTKGPVALVLIWLPGFLYFAVRRDFRFLEHWFDWLGGALFIAICVPWFWLVNAKEPGFLYTSGGIITYRDSSLRGVTENRSGFSCRSCSSACSRGACCGSSIPVAPERRWPISADSRRAPISCGAPLSRLPSSPCPRRSSSPTSYPPCRRWRLCWRTSTDEFSTNPSPAFCAAVARSSQSAEPRRSDVGSCSTCGSRTGGSPFCVHSWCSAAVG